MRGPIIALAAVTAALVLLAGCSANTDIAPPVPTQATTASPSAMPDSTPRIAIIGDFGSGDENEQAVAALVASQHPEAVFTVGDNVYSDTGYTHLVGDYYGQFVAAGKFHPSTGNHDYSEGIDKYDAYFGTAPGQRYAQVDLGDVSYFLLDDQTIWDDPANWKQQLVWLKKSASQSTSPYKVVLLHHPPFSSGSEHGSTPETQLDFAGMGIDLVIAGHDHISQRIQANEITYLVDGAGGKNLYDCVPGQVPESVFCDDEHFAALFLSPGEGALTGRFVAADGSTLDEFSIPRSQ